MSETSDKDKLSKLDKDNALLDQRVKNLERDNETLQSERRKMFWGIIGVIGMQIYDLVMKGKIGG